MKILGLTNKGGNWIDGEGWSGSGYHRILLPLALMKDVEGFVSDSLSGNMIMDAIIYNRVSQYDKIWDEVKDDFRCKVILDIDDYWYPDYYSMAKRIESNIMKADLVTVSNEFLKSKVKSINENVTVVENSIPFGEGQFTDEKVSSDKVRIFWAGGIHHQQDLHIFRNAIMYKNKLMNYEDKIEMVIGGYNDAAKNIWEDMVGSFTLEGKLPNRVICSLPATNYMEMYEHADIMVIPLENNNLYKGKSILKVLEAASKKIPCIVSNVEPYSNFKDMPVLWVNEKKDWYNHLELLINNSYKREAMGIMLYNWAKENFNFNAINEKRFSALQSMINN